MTETRFPRLALLGLFLLMAILAATKAQGLVSDTPLSSTSPASKFVFPGSDPASRQMTEADHQRLMTLLGIQQLRHGRDPSHTNSPFYANYDELKANPYPVLPDPLRLDRGQTVRSATMWWLERRPEIVEAFNREIYGRPPANLPAVTWRVVSQGIQTNGRFPVLLKRLVGHVDNSRDTKLAVNLDLTVATPTATTKPVPLILQLTFNFSAFALKQGTKPPPAGAFNPSATGWQQQVLAKGWGYATLIPTSVQEDYGAALTGGIIGLANGGQPRRLEDWGALRAWAWGASRALDYFQTDPRLDGSKVGIEGHSRYGKAALVAMAFDPRFAIAYISSSGTGGAKLYRRNFGETVENLAGSGEYHWMAGNFLKYAGPLGWNDLPVDAHELIALCAPRPVFIGGGATDGDGWADARGMFMAASAAGPVYRLLGKQDLGTTVFPPMGKALTHGELAFRQHDQGHTDEPNWPVFLDWAEKYLAPCPSVHEARN